MDYRLVLLGTVTGLVTGAFFALLDVPIPAPPELPGLMGIVGIYMGYKLIQSMNVTIDVLETIGF